MKQKNSEIAENQTQGLTIKCFSIFSFIDVRRNMMNLFQEDLRTVINRLREGGLITSQTFSRWTSLLAAGFVDFVRARGKNLRLNLSLN